LFCCWLVACPGGRDTSRLVLDCHLCQRLRAGTMTIPCARDVSASAGGGNLQVWAERHRRGACGRAEELRWRRIAASGGLPPGVSL
jgi:hypothetical protein